MSVSQNTRLDPLEVHRVPEQYQFSSQMGRALNSRIPITSTLQGMLMSHSGHKVGLDGTFAY